MGNTHNLTLIILLIVAASLIVVGSCMFVVTMSIVNWDFSVLGTPNETNVHTPSADFNSISISTSTADITLLPSEDEICSVVCVDQENLTHSVTVVDGVLKIEKIDSRTWYDHITLFSRPTSITVYLPRSEYTSLYVNSSTSDVKLSSGFTFNSIDVTLSTGDFNVEGVTTGALSISVSTGDVSAKSTTCGGEVFVKVSTGNVNLTDTTCKNLTTSGTTGDITLTSVIASESFSIERSTGDVKLDGCDASTLTVKTNTGDVRGTLLSEKIFITSASTGKVSVPHTASGGRCEISTTTGDVTIEIK